MKLKWTGKSPQLAVICHQGRLCIQLHICSCCQGPKMHTKNSALAYWCFPRLIKVNSSHILLTTSPTESRTDCPTMSWCCTCRWRTPPGCSFSGSPLFTLSLGLAARTTHSGTSYSCQWQVATLHRLLWHDPHHDFPSGVWSLPSPCLSWPSPSSASPW